MENLRSLSVYPRLFLALRRLQSLLFEVSYGFFIIEKNARPIIHLYTSQRREGTIFIFGTFFTTPHSLFNLLQPPLIFKHQTTTITIQNHSVQCPHQQSNLSFSLTITSLINCPFLGLLVLFHCLPFKWFFLVYIWTHLLLS
jgi:hypothetical protein